MFFRRLGSSEVLSVRSPQHEQLMSSLDDHFPTFVDVQMSNQQPETRVEHQVVVVLS